MQLNLGEHAYDISLYINCVLYSGRIKTLVAMVTYIFHRLIMGKVEIDICFCLNGDIWNPFNRNVHLTKFPTLPVIFSIYLKTDFLDFFEIL